MRQVKEILRQKLLLGRSHRAIARSVGIGAGSVGDTLGRAKRAKLTTWAGVEALSEDELEQRVYETKEPARSKRPAPDPATLDIELRKKGVTLQLLHLEYLEQHPDGYRYTQFCAIYNEWKKRLRPTMRIVHRAGDKTFVDYSGAKPSIVDPRTGEVQEVELFVAVLGASSYTYAEATRTQSSRDWIRSHEHAFSFFGGVSDAIVPDQLKSGVTAPCRYEPGVQRTYEELLCHYGTVGLPARQRKPRDKAKVEVGVQVAQRWILARLRNQTFHSLAELNARIRELLVELNSRKMRAYGLSRRELFERLDQPALRPLPESRFVYGEWCFKKCGIDYHVDVDGHYYSVPHRLSDERFEIRVSAATVEIYVRGARVASHPRGHKKGRHTTTAEHMPASHRAHAEWSPTRLIRWATKIGPETATLVALILRDRPHPEQGYRSCLGIMRLGKQYGSERLEAACARAVAVGARSYKHVAAILKNGIDRLPPLVSKPANTTTVVHDNLRRFPVFCYPCSRLLTVPVSGYHVGGNDSGSPCTHPSDQARAPACSDPARSRRCLTVSCSKPIAARPTPALGSGHAASQGARWTARSWQSRLRAVSMSVSSSRTKQAHQRAPIPPAVGHASQCLVRNLLRRDRHAHWARDALPHEAPDGPPHRGSLDYTRPGSGLKVGAFQCLVRNLPKVGRQAVQLLYEALWKARRKRATGPTGRTHDVFR